MATYKGFIMVTLAEYDVQQQICADTHGVERWSGGRSDNEGNTIPDLTLVDGNLFIYDEVNGVDTITDADLPPIQ